MDVFAAPAEALRDVTVVSWDGVELVLRRGDRVIRGAVERSAGRVRVHHGGLLWDFTIEDPAAAPRGGHGAGSELYAPMTGTVVQVLATEGATVEPGAPLLVVEAMKMEHRIVAPMAATILKLHVRAGDRVDVGAILVSLDPGAPA